MVNSTQLSGCPVLHPVHSLKAHLNEPYLGPGQVGLLAGPGPAEAEAVEAAVRVGPGEAEGARLAGGALHALHVGLARAVAVGVAAAVAFGTIHI